MTEECRQNDKIRRLGRTIEPHFVGSSIIEENVKIVSIMFYRTILENMRF